MCSTCDSTVVNSAKVPDVPAGLAGGGRTSDHEFMAWMGGSAGGSGGTACCCMKSDHVDALRAEDEVAANSSDAEEAWSTRSGGAEAPPVAEEAPPVAADRDCCDILSKGMS